MAIKIDPELQRQLEEAGADDLVQAVLSLGAVGKAAPRSPEDVVTIAQGAIDKAQADSGETPKRFKIFRHMDSFAVEASPRFLRSLIDQDHGLASAVANLQPGPIVGEAGG